MTPPTKHEREKAEAVIDAAKKYINGLGHAARLAFDAQSETRGGGRDPQAFTDRPRVRSPGSVILTMIHFPRNANEMSL